ncbi:MAG: TetR/AcrR family transcriptional regulator [Frankiaceae bacterium]
MAGDAAPVNAERRDAAGVGARRRRLSVEDRRQELIDAALRLFSARGPEAVSVDDIAAEAGASRALLYHYFDNKHDLYLAALRAAADSLLEQVQGPFEGTPPELLDKGLAAYLNYVEQHTVGFSALLREGPGASGEVGAIVERVREAVLQLLLAGVGVPDPPAALRVALRGWVGFVEAACAEWLENRDVDRETLEGILIGALSAAVAAAWLDPEEHSRLMLGTEE